MTVDIAADVTALAGEYPWVTFTPNLRALPFPVWMRLGAAAAKCRAIMGVPLKPAVSRQLHAVYLAKGVQATTAIEGNILSIEQVEQAMEDKLNLPESQEYHKTAVENILGACNGLLERSRNDALDVPLTLEEIAEFDRLALENLDLEDWVNPGELRERRVGVGSYLAPPPQFVPTLVSRYLSFFNDELASFTLPGQELEAAILKAVLAHLYFVWIHPFADGNGRTARLVEHRILLGAGVPSPAAQLLSNHYNATRERYYAELDRASKTGDVLGFVEYAIGGMVEQLDVQLDEIRKHQELVAWESYVHERFNRDRSEAKIRRRHLLLELSYKGEAVPKREIPDLSPPLAREYAGKTVKTLTRDLNALAQRGLVEKMGGVYRARVELIQAFRPHSTLLE